MTHVKAFVKEQKTKRFISMVPIVALIFLSGGMVVGCGDDECGPTSPGRFCADFVMEQEGLVCTDLGQNCTPTFVRRCVRWECS